MPTTITHVNDAEGEDAAAQQDATDGGRREFDAEQLELGDQRRGAEFDGAAEPFDQVFDLTVGLPG